MSDDSNAPADLSSIGMDLSQIFRPSWTVESPDSTARLAAKYDEDERPERSDRQGGNRRPERREGGPGQNRGPRSQSDRDRDSRGPRSQGGSGGGRDAKSGQGGQRGSRDRGPGRDPRNRRQEERRPEPAPKPVLEGWKLSLLPEHSALEAISKQIRSRAKAYPLFELARLVVNLSERYSVTLKPEGENSPTLFRVKTDGSLWTSRKEAVSHLLAKHLEKFYRRSTITVEAPKGSYSVVAQCGMSGVLLGPPNHHEYQSRLLALHASRFKNLPFEVYKTRIKMMRDEALMEQWKTEQSTRTVFIPIEPGSEEAAQPTEELPAVIETPEVLAETPTEETTDTTPASEETSEVSSESTEAEAPAEEPPVAETATSDAVQLTLEEAREHFQKHHAENEIETVTSDITLPGRVALHESDPLLHELLIKTLQELDRFPLPLAQIIGKELTGNGLQIFKAQKKIIHVSVARPRYLDRATTPTSEGSRSILEYLEAHPKQQRDKQWAGMLALRKEPAGEDEAAIKQREQALGTDLLWLLHQGHVIDFAMGNLQAALPPVQPQKPAQAAAAKPAGTTQEVPAPLATESEPATELVAEEVLVEETLAEESPVESISEETVETVLSEVTEEPETMQVAEETVIETPVATAPEATSPVEPVLEAPLKPEPPLSA